MGDDAGAKITDLPRYQMRGPIEAVMGWQATVGIPPFRAIKCAVPLKQGLIPFDVGNIPPSALSNARSH